jgi:hypothetical protein
MVFKVRKIERKVEQKWQLESPSNEDATNSSDIEV